MNADLETNKACNKQTYNTIKDEDGNKKKKNEQYWSWLDDCNHWKVKEHYLEE